MWLVVESEVEQLFGLPCRVVIGEEEGKVVLRDSMLNSADWKSLEGGVVPRPLDQVMLPFFSGNTVKALEFAGRLFRYPYSIEMFKKEYPEYVEPMNTFNAWVSSVGGARAGEVVQDILRYKTRPRDAAQFSLLSRCSLGELTESVVAAFRKTPCYMRETLLMFVFKFSKHNPRYNQLPGGLELIALSPEEKVKNDKMYEINKKMASTIISFIGELTRGNEWIYTKHRDKECMSRKDLKAKWNNWLNDKGIANTRCRSYIVTKKFVKLYFFGNEEKGGFIYFLKELK
jgi:hypothetical protein